MSKFEWDSQKRLLNIAKHGIDFVDAIQIFQDQDRIEAESTQGGELRFKTIGMLNSLVIFLVYTLRGSSKRIISARRASRNERQIYIEAKR